MARVALVSSKYYPLTCGVGDYSMRVGNEFLAQGHEARVFTLAPADPHPAGPDLRVTAVSGGTPALRALAVSRALYAWRPDTILLQYTAQMFGAARFGSVGVPLLSALVRLNGARLILVAHELFTSWMPRPDLLLGSISYRVQLASLLPLANRTFVTTASRLDVTREMARLMGVAERIGLTRVGANALPVPRRRVDGRVRLGLFSTLAVGKRFDIALEAFRRIRERYPRAELVLAGDLGSANSYALRALKQAIDAHPYREAILLTGKLDLARIPEIVADIDVFLFPMDTGANTRSGTLPVALGSGVPVVATRGPETDELFRADENVIFAESLSGDAFARAAQRVLEDAALAERVGNGGLALYQEHLTWDRIARSLLA